MLLIVGGRLGVLNTLWFTGAFLVAFLVAFYGVYSGVILYSCCLMIVVLMGVV